MKAFQQLFVNDANPAALALDEIIARQHYAEGGFADLIVALCLSDVFRGDKQK